MPPLLWVCLGGAAGTGARYLLSGWAPRVLGAAFPYGTLFINVSGSFLIGLLMHVGIRTEWLSPTARVTLTTGVLGGFTTYSAFNQETIGLASRGATAAAAGNVVVTIAACLAAGLAGAAVARGIG